MALVSAIPVPPAIPLNTDPLVTPMDYQGVTVDTKFVSAANLLTHIEGSSWTVNYYSQVLNNNSALAGQNVTRNALYQQYKLITELELKVTGPLTTTQDATSNSLIMTGSANVYPCIVPNIGDMFIADIGDGREGIFKVTASERKSIFKDTIHAVEYQLIDYATPERLGDLNMKVIDTLIFVRNFLQHGQNPLIRNNDFSLIKDLQGYYIDLLSRYFKDFTSNEYKTLLLPGQTCPIYDHFLTKSIMSIFTTDDSPEIRNIRIMNLDDDDVLKSTTIWDMLKAKDRKLHKYCIRQSALVSARTFTQNPMMEGIYHSGIQYVVYPLNPMLTVDYQIAYLEKPLAEQAILDTPSLITNINDLFGATGLNGLTLPDIPPIHKVLVDNYYVFSQAFYDKALTGQSLLELCVNNYLDGKATDNIALLTLCSTAHAWDKLEEFYFTPILLILIKGSIRSI